MPPHVRDTILTLVDSIHIDQSRCSNPEQPSVQTKTVPKKIISGVAANKLGRTILKSLRHTPEFFGFRMDTDGWVYASELAAAFGEEMGLDRNASSQRLVEILDEMGMSDRVQFKRKRIRAAYGHSTTRFVPSSSAIPDKPLYHGTSANNWSMIELFGLAPIKRRFVQLTTELDYASQIANSHGPSPLVLQVATAHAIECDVKFYPTDTHVWQATTIPSICLQVWMDDAFDLDEPLF